MILTALFLTLAAQQVDCANAVAQLDMNRCATIDFEKADADLNTLWPHVLTAVSKYDEYKSPNEKRPSAVEDLRQSQRAWIVDRDNYCRAYSYQSRGGSMESMLYNGCRATATQERIKALRELILDR